MKKYKLKEYNHQYYLANRERLKEAHKKHYWKNRDWYRKWHKKNEQTEKRKEYLKNRLRKRSSSNPKLS